MANLRDLMLSGDALEMEGRYESALRDHNECEERIGRDFRESEQRAIFDWEVDVPEFDW
jgi:hypothetical protein